MPVNFRINYSKSFNREVKSICSYILDTTRDIEVADRQRDMIRTAAESLVIFPERHKVYRIDSKGREVRSFPVDNYRLIYIVDKRRNIVEILHVIHSRRNIDSLI